MTKDFEYYRDCFASLHTNVSRGIPAPHKPLLLLAVMDLIEQGAITSRRIYLTDQLIEAFKANASRYIGRSIVFKPNIGQPYYHMDYEPFWRLVRKVDILQTAVAAEPTVRFGKKSKPAYTANSIRRDYEYADIDEELFRLMQNQDARAKLRTILISTYLLRQPNSATPLLVTLPVIGAVLTVIA